MISPLLLSRRVVALENARRSHYAQKNLLDSLSLLHPEFLLSSTPSELTLHSNRIRAANNALTIYLPPPIDQSLGEFNPFVILEVFRRLEFAQRVHLTLYIHIWQDLHLSSEYKDSEDGLKGDPDISVTSIVFSVLGLLAFDAPPVPCAWGE